MQEFLKKFQMSESIKKSILCMFLISLALAIFIDTKEPPQAPTAGSADEAADFATFIPSGYSLVPIQIINSSGLDSILGSYGIVDLFSSTHKKSLAQDVRIIRSPNDASLWAVLIPSSQVRPLLDQGSEFYVTVKPSKSKAQSNFTSHQNYKKREIIYEN